MSTGDEDTCPWCTHGRVTLEEREINTVATRPDPKGGEITRCADCYAEYVANHTLLTQLESHVLTLANDGHGEKQIEHIVGRSLRNVRQTLETALERREEARERLRTAEWTLETVEELKADTLSEE